MEVCIVCGSTNNRYTHPFTTVNGAQVCNLHVARYSAQYSDQKITALESDLLSKQSTLDGLVAENTLLKQRLNDLDGKG